jgi:hypothetical protein
MTPALKNLLLLLAALEQFVAAHPASVAVTPAPKTVTAAKTTPAAAPANNSAPVNNAAACFLGTIPFGGQISQVELCCDGSQLIHIGQPSQGSYLLTPFTGQCLFDNRAIRPGAWVLGSAMPGGVCLDLANRCSPKPVFDLKGIITMVGTSQ